MNAKLKGTVCGIVAAVSYGTNPLGALFLYGKGINAHSVLFYRFLLAACVLGMILLWRREGFSVTRREMAVLGILGVLFATSSLSLFVSFHHMDAGVASTLLFVYPVIVAVMMALFFHEKVTLVTVFSIFLALVGIGLLYQGDNGGTLSTVGVLLVMLSSLTYAVYIIVVNKSSLVMSSVKLTFYVLFFCVLTVGAHSLLTGEDRIQMLTTPAMWGFALMLALVPTVISLIMMVISDRFDADGDHGGAGTADGGNYRGDGFRGKFHAPAGGGYSADSVGGDPDHCRKIAVAPEDPFGADPRERETFQAVDAACGMTGQAQDGRQCRNATSAGFRLRWSIPERCFAREYRSDLRGTEKTGLAQPGRSLSCAGWFLPGPEPLSLKGWGRYPVFHPARDGRNACVTGNRTACGPDCLCFHGVVPVWD